MIWQKEISQLSKDGDAAILLRRFHNDDGCGYMLKISYALIAGALTFIIRYLATLALIPAGILMFVCFFAMGLAMIFVIPISLLMMIFGSHETFLTGLHGFVVGLEWMVFGFLAGLGCALIKFGWASLSEKLQAFFVRFQPMEKTVEPKASKAGL